MTYPYLPWRKSIRSLVERGFSAGYTKSSTKLTSEGKIYRRLLEISIRSEGCLMDLDTAHLQNFTKSLARKGRRPATVDSYRRDAESFLKYMTSENLNYKDLEPETLNQYQQWLTHSDKSNSIRRKVIGARQFFRFLADEGIIQDSPFDDAPIPERSELLPKPISYRSIKKLIDSLAGNSGLKAARDRVILCLIALEGLKASELIDIKWHGLFLSDKEFSLKIPGSRSRRIFLEPETAIAMRRYKSEVALLQEKRQRKLDRICLGFKGKDASLVLDKMTRHGVKFLLYELGQAINYPKLNTEILRHHAVSFQLAKGKSPEELMNHLGLRRLGNIAKHLGSEASKQES